MAELLEKCDVCHGLIDQEDLFCANCGTEAPHETVTPLQVSETLSAHSFDCQGCGASMSYDASAQTLRCPFCGSEHLSQRKHAQAMAPEIVVPFKIGRAKAESILRQWLGSSFWRPSDLADEAVITKFAPVFVPYWVFEATTYTYWTADSSNVPAGARGDWVPVSGKHHGRYAGLLIGASGVLSPNETESLCPFDLAQAVQPEQVDLDNAIVETFKVQRKYARPLARRGLEYMETNSCKKYVAGRVRNMKVNVRLKGLASQPVLLPVWVMAYRYKGQPYRFLLNGQTGRFTGKAPTSLAKIAMVVLAVLLGVLAIFGTIAIGSQMGANDVTPSQTMHASLDEGRGDGAATDPELIDGELIDGELIDGDLIDHDVLSTDSIHRRVRFIAPSGEGFG